MSKIKTEQRLLKELLEKGYGEDERKKWRERYRRKLKARMELQKRKNGKTAPSENEYEYNDDDNDIYNPEGSAIAPLYPAKPEDSSNRIPPSLRRKIDSYAYRNRFKTTKLKERILSMFTVINPGIKDFVNQDLIELLIKGRGFKNDDPSKYCLLDNMDALFYASGFLLGYYRSFSNSIQKKEIEDNVKKIHTHIRNKMPYGVEFLKVFRERDEGLVRLLEVIKIRYRHNTRIHISKLFRIVHYIYILYFRIGGIEAERLNNIITSIAEINKAHETKTVHYKQIDQYAEMFKAAYNNLKTFKHELFPTFLKIMGSFFTERESMKNENLIMIYRTLGIRPNDIIHDKILKKDKNAEPEIKNRLKYRKKEKPAEPFSKIYWNTLFTLKNLFYGSGIENIEQWAYIIPYFDLKIFTKNLPFHENIQIISRFDPMGQIMVFHRILDNMLSSINFYALDQVLGKTGELNDELMKIRKEWQTVNTAIFTPYLNELNNYYKTAGNTEEKQKTNLYSKKLLEELNQLKNLVIKNYGEIIIGLKTKVTSLRVFKLAKDLYETLHEIYSYINIGLINKKDKKAIELLGKFEEKRIIDFELNEEKPVIVKIKGLIESQLNTKIEEIPMKAQLVFFEIFVSLANMYEYLLNNDNSFYRNKENNSIFSGNFEKSVWEKTKEDISTSLIAASEEDN